MGESVATANSSTAVMSSIPPFLSKTYDMVDDPLTDDVVSWSSGNNSFVVWNVPEFAKQFLPKYFKHNNFSSFVRQLNTYGFRKVDPDRWEFANEGFLRGQKQILKSIVRRKPAQVQPPQQPQVQHSSVGACVEVGKFGLEEEVERLQRDKNVLMQELVRLRQQQQVTEHHLQNVGQKVHVMEQRQQQMMSFLAKAVQSPGFLNQFSQQSNEANQHISESNKKRRLPVEDQMNSGSHGVNGLSRQIVRYQSSMNDATNTMLQQIQQMSNSSSHESLSSNHGSFLLGDVPNSNISDNGSSSNGSPGVTLADVSSIPAGLYPAMKYHDPCETNQVLETSLPFSQGDLLPPTQGVAASGSSSSDLVGCETDNGECLDPIMAVLDGSIELEADALNELLPEVQDSFWEQFIGESPVIGETDELISGSVENELIMEQLELQSSLGSVWSKNQQMNHLTEQMGLLTSDALGK
ncbi:Heat shock factor (HSF)-type DNA-binding [Arabidopsis thaliana x Arabidopsis arenosa]|uniref:Heat shock factor (HSF)-type DNA-binding n=1 Tax=Arabidopsis thaliana x Arabidopsis arenosa TaxID=1240361 RepID=A0A8T2AP83_9BRAS|nr:Heat shock factor (HSF)-type DNA-binding [Arabidopsis thaliana x Arabidopsis arenosa]